MFQTKGKAIAIGKYIAVSPLRLGSISKRLWSLQQVPDRLLSFFTTKKEAA